MALIDKIEEIMAEHNKPAHVNDIAELLIAKISKHYYSIR
jgi:hypothetical protein